MADTKKVKVQNIPFIVDGVVRIVKSVSKNTTCNDVIAKLPNLQAPLAVFLSVDGDMKELPAKTKLLKVWRANGSAKKVEFVIKKSETVTKKGKGDSRKLFGDRKKRDKQDVMSSQQSGRLSKDTLKQVSDLAFYVRYQKMKVTNLSKQSEQKQSTPQSKLMRKMTSHASTNSMDAFLERADLDAMAGFLSFCGQVTTEKLRGKTDAYKDEKVDITLFDEDKMLSAAEKKRMNSILIDKSLKSTKLGLKRKFVPKTMEPKRTSTATIGSTDTGYHSVETGSQTGSQVDYPTNACMQKPRRLQTLLLTDLDGFQRHSTPVNTRNRKRTADTLDCTLTEEKLSQMDDCPMEGKSVIFEKFMADQTTPAVETGNDVDFAGSPLPKRPRLRRESLPVFGSAEDRCRFLWNKYYDSDSDTDSEACNSSHGNLDAAFITSVEHVPRKLRRESAISNLNKIPLAARHSLPARYVTKVGPTEEFNYSFNCSFPRMDESKSVNFTVDYSFSDSDVSDDFTRKLSSDVRTESFDEDSLDLTSFEDNVLNRNLSLSDEFLTGAYF